MRSVSLLAVAATLWTRVRAVPITEASGSAYSQCTAAELSSFNLDLLAQSTDCFAKTSLSWDERVVLTTDQRVSFCSCTTLLQKLSVAVVPHCYVALSHVIPCPYAKVIDYTFGLCNADGSPATDSTAALAQRCGRVIGDATTAPPFATTDPPIQTTKAPAPVTKVPIPTTDAPTPDPTVEPVKTTPRPDPTSQSPDDVLYTHDPVTSSPTPLHTTSSNHTVAVIVGSVGAAAAIALVAILALRCRMFSASKTEPKQHEIDGVDGNDGAEHGRCEASTPRGEFQNAADISIKM